MSEQVARGRRVRVARAAGGVGGAGRAGQPARGPAAAPLRAAGRHLPHRRPPADNTGLVRGPDETDPAEDERPVLRVHNVPTVDPVPGADGVRVDAQQRRPQHDQLRADRLLEQDRAQHPASHGQLQSADGDSEPTFLEPLGIAFGV